MHKRKRYDDHERRESPNHRAHVAARARRAVVEIGEPSDRKIEVSLPDLASDIAELPDHMRESILDMVKAVVVEQPHKISLLALLFEILNRKSPKFVLATVEMVHEEISKALLSGNYGALKLLVRFVCSLTVVDHDSVLQTLVSLAARAADAKETTVATALFTTVVFAAVYFKHAGGTISDELNAEILRFSLPDVSNTSAEEPFFGPEAPYTAKPIIAHLVTAAKAIVESSWDTSFLMDASIVLAENPEDGAGEKHRFPGLHIPEVDSLPPARSSDEARVAAELGFMPMRTLVYLPTVHRTVPDPDTMFGALLRDVAGDIIANLDFNRKEVSRQLISFDLFFNSKLFAPPGIPFDTIGSLKEGSPTIKVEDLALEVVLENLLRLPLAEFPTVYFDTIMIEACIMAPQSLAPVLGRALRFFFANCSSLDAELFWRVVEWFAHHVSNFAFTWKWNEWSGSLALPANHPQMVFMRELILKQVRLSYAQRVRDVLPEEFHGLVPDIPDVPAFKWDGDKAVRDLMEALEKSQTEQDEAVTQLKLSIQERLGADAEPGTADNELTEIVVTALLELGNPTPSHTAKWISKAADLVKEVTKDDSVIIKATLEYWKDSAWVGALALDRFVAANLVTPDSLVKFVITHRDLLVSSLGWEILKKYWQAVPNSIDGLDTPSDDEWDTWWSSRLKKALTRRAEASRLLEEIQNEDLIVVREADTKESESTNNVEIEGEPKGTGGQAEVPAAQTKAQPVNGSQDADAEMQTEEKEQEHEQEPQTERESDQKPAAEVSQTKDTAPEPNGDEAAEAEPENAD